MGDRCWLELDVRKSDYDRAVQVFAEHGELDPYTLEDRVAKDVGSVHLIDEEVNGGGVDTLNALANAGISFTGWHGEGDNYGAYVFAGHDGKFALVPCDSDACQPVVTVGSDGKPDGRGLREARKYHRMHAAVKTAFARCEKAQRSTFTKEM